MAFCNQMVAPWKFSSSTELQNSSIAWYLSFILNPTRDFNLWRQIGHVNIGRLLDSSRWLLPFIAHEKNTQCWRANKWHISWAITWRICITIKDFSSWWSFPLLSWPSCLIEGVILKGEVKCFSLLGAKESMYLTTPPKHKGTRVGWYNFRAIFFVEEGIISCKTEHSNTCWR